MGLHWAVLQIVGFAFAYGKSARGVIGYEDYHSLIFKNGHVVCFKQMVTLPLCNSLKLPADSGCALCAAKWLCCERSAVTVAML